MFLFSVLVFLVCCGGCHFKFAARQTTPAHPLNERFYIGDIDAGKTTANTKWVLRSLQYDENQDASVNTLAHILSEIEAEPTAELLAAFSELAYMEGRRQESHNPGMAAELYAASSLQAFNYLFDPRYSESRNSYDSRFHNVHLLYNSSLERLLRLLMNEEKNLRLRPGDDFYVQTDDRRWNVQCRLITGTWRPDEIDSFTFAYDYKLLGVEHEYRQGGLGVPLVAKRKESAQAKPDAKYYPVGVRFPVTAFLRPAKSNDPEAPCHAVLELYDPLVTSTTTVDGMTVPLETDLTTPLVCFMSMPEVQLMPTLGLVRPDELLKSIPKEKGSHKSNRIIKGMYMMEPYDPNRIPVVLIHGLWSSPFTWMEMFNSLRSDVAIRQKYQFWFYFYPSGQPFWVSASQLRDDLREIRHTLDPQKQIDSFDEMVLIGHSMGGLIARLQVMSAQDHFWNRVSSVPFDQTKLEPSTKTELNKWFFFEPNPSVRRVVTIATPFDGSQAANSVSQWFAQRMISIPGQLNKVLRSFASSDKSYLSKDSLLEVKTSVESLSPECPVYEAMDASGISTNVICNNIVGIWREDSIWPTRPKPGDGVVEIESAHRTDVESEAVVQAPHMEIHMHPATIRETRRLLLEHLRVMQSEQAGSRPIPGQVFASRPQDLL